MLVLLDSRIEVNAIHLILAKELDLLIRLTVIGSQKINDTKLDIYEIIVVVFSVMNKVNQVKFFEEIFLVANISPKVVFRMLFLTLSAVNIDFLD